MLDDLVAAMFGMDALDERFIAHRRIEMDLLMTLVAIAVTKVTSMIWLAWTD
jgi:hypothetical protein